MGRDPKHHKTNEMIKKQPETRSPIDPRLAQYPSNRRVYERMMRHDAYRKTRGGIRQIRWGEQDQ